MANTFKPSASGTTNDFNWTTTTFTGTLTTNSTYTGFTKRVGDTMYGMVKISFSGDPGVYSSATITVPNSLSIDTAKVTAGNPWLGEGWIRRAGTNYATGILYNDSTTMLIFPYVCGGSNAGLALTNISDSFPNATDFANGDHIDVVFSIPISGWS